MSSHPSPSKPHSAMRRRPFAAWVRASCALAVLAASVGPVQAGPLTHLDDSMSIAHGGPFVMRWDADRPSSRRSQLARVSIRTSVIFNVADHAGQRVRIHQTLSQISGPWLVRWSGGGRFIDGESRPGQRVVFYEGLLPSGMRRMEGEVTYEFIVDGNFVNEFQNLTVSYEIETLP